MPKSMTETLHAAKQILAGKQKLPEDEGALIVTRQQAEAIRRCLTIASKDAHGQAQKYQDLGRITMAAEFLADARAFDALAKVVGRFMAFKEIENQTKLERE